jgi:cobalt/nickel transport system ATP-binding protein
VSLFVHAGERIVVLGANGCGKSTPQAPGGLIFPQKGAYRAFAHDHRSPPLLDPFGMFFRKEIGILFQNSDAQLFNLTVEDEIAFGPLQMNDPPDDVRSKVSEAIDRFRIRGLAGRPPFALSAGEKKKVAIASVMVMDPQVLLLDEPTAGLDPRSSRALADLILEMGTWGRR